MVGQKRCGATISLLQRSLPIDWGLALELVPTSRDTIIETLACEPSATASEEEKPDPEGDIALAALAITGERDEKVDFSSWYYVGNQAVVTMKEAEQPSSRILCARFDRHCIAALREVLYCSNNRERKSTRNLRKHG